MKHKRIWIAVLMAMALLAMSACTSATPAPTQVAQKAAVNVAALKGPTGIGMVKLWDDNQEGITLNDYTFTFAGAPDEVVGMLTSGEVDIAAVPINLAGSLYNKTQGNIQITALITRGVLYVLENGDTVQSIADLEGQTVYATGQGSTPEFVLNYLLDVNGLDDTIVEYKVEHAELATLLVSGDVKIGMLPEPFVTTVLSKNPDVRIALDLNEQWREATAAKGNETTLSMSALVVRKEFAQQNPEALAAFISEYTASVNYVNGNVADAAALVEEAGIMASAALAQQAIPNCNIVCITGDDMKEAVTKLYEVFYAANPLSIGGAMPLDDFFYTHDATN